MFNLNACVEFKFKALFCVFVCIYSFSLNPLNRFLYHFLFIFKFTLNAFINVNIESN